MSEIRKETETINTLVDTYIKKGNIKGAIDAAKLGGRELTTEEIDSLVLVCRKKGDIGEALDAANLGASSMAVDVLVPPKNDVVSRGMWRVTTIILSQKVTKYYTYILLHDVHIKIAISGIHKEVP